MLSTTKTLGAAAIAAVVLSAGAAQAASITLSGTYFNEDGYQFTEGTFAGSLLPNPETAYTTPTVWEASYSINLSWEAADPFMDGGLSDSDSIVFGPISAVDAIEPGLALLGSLLPTVSASDLDFLTDAALDVAGEVLGSVDTSAFPALSAFGTLDVDTDGSDDFFYDGTGLVTGTLESGLGITGDYFVEALLDLTPFILALGTEYLDPVFGDGTGAFLSSIEQLDYTVTATLAPVPLPAGAALMGTALLGLGVAARRRRSRVAA
ncbi:MAG: hypothetical protein AAFQ51_02980 [Pseudomonadota bacterium]